MGSKDNENPGLIHSKEKKNECSERSTSPFVFDENVLADNFNKRIILKGEETVSCNPELYKVLTFSERKKWMTCKPELDYKTLRKKYPAFPPVPEDSFHASISMMPDPPVLHFSWKNKKSGILSATIEIIPDQIDSAESGSKLSERLRGKYCKKRSNSSEKNANTLADKSQSCVSDKQFLQEPSSEPDCVNQTNFAHSFLAPVSPFLSKNKEPSTSVPDPSTLSSTLLPAPGLERQPTSITTQKVNELEPMAVIPLENEQKHFDVASILEVGIKDSATLSDSRETASSSLVSEPLKEKAFSIHTPVPLISGENKVSSISSITAPDAPAPSMLLPASCLPQQQTDDTTSKVKESAEPLREKQSKKRPKLAPGSSSTSECISGESENSDEEEKYHLKKRNKTVEEEPSISKNETGLSKSTKGSETEIALPKSAKEDCVLKLNSGSEKTDFVPFPSNDISDHACEKKESGDIIPVYREKKALSISLSKNIDSLLSHAGPSKDKGVESHIPVKTNVSSLQISSHTAVNEDDKKVKKQKDESVEVEKMTERPEKSEDPISESLKFWKARSKKRSDLSVDFNHCLRKIPKISPITDKPESMSEDESIILPEEELCSSSESSPEENDYDINGASCSLFVDTKTSGEDRFELSLEELLNLRNDKFSTTLKWNATEFSFYSQGFFPLSINDKIKSLLTPISYDYAIFEYERFSSFVESNDPSKKNLAVLLLPLFTCIIYHFLKNGCISDGLRSLDYLEKIFPRMKEVYKSVAIVFKQLKKFHGKKDKKITGIKSAFEELIASVCEIKSKQNEPYDILQQQHFLKKLRLKKMFSFTPESMEALVSFLTHQQIKSSVLLQLYTYFNFHVDKNVSVEGPKEMMDSTTSDDPSSIKHTLNNFIQYKEILMNTKFSFQQYIVKPVPSDPKEEPFSKLFHVGEEEAYAKELVAKFSPDEATKPRFQYSQLIVQALSSVENMEMTPSEICKYIAARYAYFKLADRSWQNSIFKILNSSKFFERLPSNELGSEDSFKMQHNSKDKLLKLADKDPYGTYNISAVDVTVDHKYIACSFDDSLIQVFRRKDVTNIVGDHPSLADFESAVCSATDKDENEYELFKVLASHRHPVYGLCFAVSKEYIPNLLLFSAGYDAVKLWSTEDFNLIGEFLHSSMYLNIDVSSCAEFFVVASKEKVAELWHVGDPTSPKNIFKGHSNAVDFCRFHPNSLYVATASSVDKTLRLFGTVDGKPVRLFVGHEAKITTIHFSIDGEFLLSGDMSGKIFVWNIAKGESTSILHDHKERVLSLSCDSTGTFLASVGYDHCVRTYDYKKLIRKYLPKKKRKKEKNKSPQLSATRLFASPYFIKYCSSSLVVVATCF